MKELILAMGVFAVVGSITPGPVNILAIRRGSGARNVLSVAYVLGASLSYTLVVWLMGKGGEQLLSSRLAVQSMQWTGGAYLLYLSWRIAASGPIEWQREAGLPLDSVSKAFAEGCMTQSLNPKAWMVALSGVGLYVLPQPDVQVALGLFCGVSLLACAVGVGSWAIAGRVLSRWLNAPARQKIFNQAMAVLLALSVANMLR